jgi:cob(I)alamin adenosyltransferase
MKIYTKTGDQGETGLFRGPRVPKHDLRVEAYGNVDELNALLGSLLTDVTHPEIRKLILAIQHELFEIGADLATPPQQQETPELRINAAMTENLEHAIDQFEAQLPELTYFILPGGSKGGAILHLARTVCRRAERSITHLHQEQPMNPEILRYINRLSDLLFVLARAENQHTNSPEIRWEQRKD